MPPPQVVICGGTTGTGKTSVGRALAERLGYTFIDGDDHHTDANKEKMQNGMGLTDKDREPWLNNLNAMARTRRKPLVLACSALKRAYRRRLVDGLAADEWRMLFFYASAEVLNARVAKRKGHYAGTSLLASQFDTLELPSREEANNVAIIDVNQPLDCVIEAAIASIKQ